MFEGGESRAFASRAWLTPLILYTSLLVSHGPFEIKFRYTITYTLFSAGVTDVADVSDVRCQHLLFTH